MRPRYLLRGPGERLLDLGNCGEGDFRRQHRIEHVIVAQIGMGEHVVADLLARAQAAAMADHQPRFGTQHCQVVADRLRIARADTDIDQRDAFAVGTNQVIGGHLVPAPCSVGQLRAGLVGLLGQHHAARTGQRGIPVLAELRTGPVNEFIDIAVIVREQDEALEMLGAGAGVVRQPREAEIGP